MAGNHYGQGGRIESDVEIKNRELENRIVECLRDKLGAKYIDYTCLSSNHFSGGLSSPYVVLPTRDISISLWVNKSRGTENRFVINHNTKENSTVVHKQSIYHPDIKKEDLDIVLACIASASSSPSPVKVGGASRRRNSQRARRLGRVRTQRRRKN